MREFIKGWRRKVGCAALVVACIVVGAWMRGEIVCDEFWFSFNGRRNSVYHLERRVIWQACDSRDIPPVWVTKPLTTEDDRWRTNMLIDSHRNSLRKRQFSSWTFQYSFLIPPLLVLSGYLILWPRRKLPSIGGQPDA